MDEHEAKHRALVRDMVGDLESPDIEVDRGLARKPEAKPVPTNPQPPLPNRKLQ